MGRVLKTKLYAGVMWILAAAFPAVVLVVAAPVAAQQAPCAPHDVVMTALAEKHNEHVVVQALQSDGRMLEITANAEGGWTAVITAPSGMACLVAAGENFTALPLGEAKPKGNPS